MKDIKDYLHLYLGSIEVQCGKLPGWPDSQKRVIFDWWWWFKNWEKKFTPILRPLSDMTEEERCEVSTLVPPDESPYWVKNIAEVTKWYLDRGFDLFGLIEAGLAIDKTDRN